MVDFKKALQAYQERQGFCRIPVERYATIRGIRVDCMSGVQRDTHVHYCFDLTPSEPTFKLLDGSTGYESWFLTDVLHAAQYADKFCACAGAYQRYDELWLDLNHLKEILAQFLSWHPEHSHLQPD